jgi:transcription elongation factor SPT6
VWFRAWDEIHGVFGDGHEYDWALAGDDEMEAEDEQSKPEMKYQDVCAFFTNSKRSIS